MKNYFSIALAMAIAVPIIFVSSSVSASEVCGMDGETYESAEAAETAQVTVSYEFACTETENEDDLYEAVSDVHFNGQLIEIGSTDLPTTLVVQNSTDGMDYTIEVSEDAILGQRRDQVTVLSDWIPGDQIKVVGQKNENTGVIESSMLVNLSINLSQNSGANGWITNIDEDNKIITYQWANAEHNISYDDDTRFVSGLTNPASVSDLEINDRIRGRLLIRSGADPLAKIVVVLRRGENLFMKIRTIRPNATILEINGTVAPTTIKVKITHTEGLREGDANNLIEEGAEITLNITEDTKIVRKYFGITTLEEFTVGDSISIVGRVNDDGTVDAKLLKNASVWRTTTQGHAGVVTKVNSDENFFMIDWTPIKHPTKKMIDKARANNPDVKITDLVKKGETKSIKISVNDDTAIMIGTDTNADLSTINVDDKVRIRGTRTGSSFVADTIVVVNTLPEIELPESKE